MRFLVRNGHSWRSRQHLEVDAPIPRHEGSVQNPHQESDQRCSGTHQCPYVLARDLQFDVPKQNLARRTAKYDVISAWDALLKANGPKVNRTHRRFYHFLKRL